MSCYCSASHTDNNYSTDEHDSVRDSAHRPTAHSLTQKLGLHQSDSGADLSEYHDQHEAKSIQNLLASYGKTFQTTETELEDEFDKVNILVQHQEDKDLKFESKIINIQSSDHLTNNVKVLSYDPSICNENEFHVENPLCNLEDKDFEIHNIFKNVSLNDGTSKSYKEDVTLKYKCDHKSRDYPYYSMYSKTKSIMDIAWEKYWSENGERIIWTTWIRKYADYINPEYLQQNVHLISDEKLEMKEAIEKFSEQNTCFPSQAHRNCEIDRSNFEGIFSKTNNIDDSEIKAKDAYNINFSFDDVSKQEVTDKDAEDNRKKLTNFETSPETGDGWNPLSPFSMEESYNQQSNAEDERLLTRCDSINESIAKTNATSDSMTNVTKMTLTSSSCDSISTNSSSLISSVTSSIESNITNTSSDQEYAPEDTDKYWQHLWKENFQIEYQNHYKLFIEKYKREQSEIMSDQSYNQEHNDIDMKEQESDESIDQDFTQKEIDTPNKINISESKNASNKNFSYAKKEKTKKKRLIMESVGMLIQNLIVKSIENESNADKNEKINEMECSQEIEQEIDQTFIQNENSTIISNDNNSIKKKSSNGGDGDDPNEDKPIILKRRYNIYIAYILFLIFYKNINVIFMSIFCFSHEAEYEETGEGLESVKKAFSLMGYTFNENYEQSNFQGEVVYRKKNIRLQNRQLKMKYYRSKPTNKHIYFDDNGVEITNTIDKVNKIFHKAKTYIDRFYFLFCFILQVKHYLSYCPVLPSAIIESQPSEKGSYTAQFTSSSDDECDHSLKKKLQTKRFVFSKPSTSSIDSGADKKQFNDHDTLNIFDNQNDVFQSIKNDNIYFDQDETSDSTKCVSEDHFPEQDNENFDALNIDMDIDENHSNNEIQNMKLSDEDSIKKTLKKKRKKQSKRNISLPIEIDNDKTLIKYWLKRYRLFSKFDQGIKLDRGMFFNIVYMKIYLKILKAKYLLIYILIIF